MTQPSYIPENAQAVTPYMIVPQAQKLIDFLTRVFGATIACAPAMREDGSIMHAELDIDGAKLMLADATLEYKANKATFYVYVANVDATYQKALSYGATEIQAPEDSECGDRYGAFEDYFGNQWWVGTRIAG